MPKEKTSKQPEQSVDEVIHIILNRLERLERRIWESRKDCKQHEMEVGWERDQLTYRMGCASECKELLMCLGEKGWAALRKFEADHKLT